MAPPKALLPGTKVQLWPKDTYYKYGVVVTVDRQHVTFKITMVEPGEKHYCEGDIVKIPRSMLHVCSRFDVRGSSFD
ncbi:MAG: hypothetical protein JL56_08460 [Desulfotomaculum sp. BICA1-6]|nr:MAG: hypothetical protein VR67_09760 [Peptococcaceae bacterium BRH_c8a]KJS75249.1 MAG: hypothetical protein JL56_08460 [Desulfotomaculum sp. BICA1-6]